MANQKEFLSQPSQKPKLSVIPNAPLLSLESEFSALVGLKETLQQTTIRNESVLTGCLDLLVETIQHISLW